MVTFRQENFVIARNLLNIKPGPQWSSTVAEDFNRADCTYINLEAYWLLCISFAHILLSTFPTTLLNSQPIHLGYKNPSSRSQGKCALA